MGQDSWNLQYGKSHPAKYRRGTNVDMHNDEGYGGPKMIPGYAGAYKNSKTKVIKSLKANGNPKTFGPDTSKKSIKYADESRKTKVERRKQSRGR
jgi:hypothetical protein